jgi:hypothetical protein
MPTLHRTIQAPLRPWRLAFSITSALVALTTSAAAQRSLPALPDSSGWGVHVLTVAADPAGAVWVGTYGQGIFRLPRGARSWERIRHDSTKTSISWDFVQAIGFGPRGQVWYGTVGNGWGISADGGRTWRNWTFSQLGPEWQYVAPDGIVVRGDTTVIATADGLQATTDDGAHWTAIGDSAGKRARGPADTALALLPNEYVTVLGREPRGWAFQTQQGPGTMVGRDGAWRLDERVLMMKRVPRNTLRMGRTQYVGTPCGLRPARAVAPCLKGRAPEAEAPRTPSTTWFRRPIDEHANNRIDQTYRYGSTMGGNFQQHQGVEFNNPDGTPVHAIGDGEVVYAGPAEAGALTVAIRHDQSITADSARLNVFSVYYHSSALETRVGDRVTAGQVISRVGNTGRATNDHLHLEVHAAPTDSVAAIVDSLQRFPAYTTNPELWIEQLPGTGIVAGQVFDSTGTPVRQARIYGLQKSEPAETPYSFAETYGDRAHGHPLYREHFAVGDVPIGTYTVGVMIDGRRVLRRVTVEPGKLTWVVFR